jgi:hypothetical protein
MKMSEGGSVVDHLNEFNRVTNQLSSVKVDFDDEVRALLILFSLPDPGGYRGPPTFSKWLKTVFWPFWQFTIFSRFSLPGPF